MQIYLEDMEWERLHPDGPGSDYDSDDTVPTGTRAYGAFKIPHGQPLPPTAMSEEEQEGDNVEFVDRSYPIHPDHMMNICKFIKMEKGDITVLVDIYTTMDHKGTNNASLRDVLCAFMPLCATSVEECVKTCCTIYDVDDTSTVGYGVLLHVFRLIIDGVDFFGDKVVTDHHIKDVVDSIFTMEGKVEGFICYDDYLPFIATHPVVVLLGSVQFQGQMRTKYKGLVDYETTLRNMNERPAWRDQLLLKEHRIENGDEEKSEKGSDHEDETTAN
jgi:hypothetical protein